jgi:signal transduction histidine kinase
MISTGRAEDRRLAGKIAMDDQPRQRRTPPPAEPEPADGRPGEQFSQAILSASADGILAVNEHGIIQVCNPAAQELLGRPPDQLVGSPFGFPVATDEATDIDVRLPNGSTHVVEMRIAATTWEDRPLYIAALREVTKDRHTERRLHNALEQQHVVVAVTAHELQNPLAAIALATRQLRLPETTTTPERRAEALDHIQERTGHLQKLVRKYLTTSRIETGTTTSKPIPVRVLELLLERLADFSYRAQDVQVACSPHIMALADRDEFSEMIGNYLDNAFSYGHPPITIEATERNGSVDVRICDRGPGVPDSFTQHLFKRYSREPHTQRKSEGSGLGLWIVRQLARANRGDAWYEPNPSGGACFAVKLPAEPHS